MVYGYYPDVVSHANDEERILKFLSDSYLYKDIFLYRGIKKPEKMLELLKALAWQIGSEVNYSELGKLIGIDNQTAEEYIHLLSQTFVIYKLDAFHTNQRKELRKAKKIYFNDVGIRNALINDFRPIEIRNDKGNLFENFMINELRKQNEYQRIYANLYFWRTTDQKEIDLIIEKNGLLKAMEFKWSERKKVNLTKTFSNAYPNHEFYVVNSENFYEYIS
jgi:predicted AAA+ superfamily ATPase